MALFVFTFLAYWLAGPLSTPYDFQLSQANNLVHGHLDMTSTYTHNLGVLERVLYDGKGFCLPVDDPRGRDPAEYVVHPRITADCKNYMQHSLGPAFLLVPLVLVFGLSVNQTLVSVFFGGLSAVLIYAIVRHFTSDSRIRLALTVLGVFGTTLWYSAADGSVWHFAHATAVFFVFGAIYATVVQRNPLLAGLLVGAAFMCRPTMILAGFFPLVAFADRWLLTDAGRAIWRRVRLRPLIELSAGVAPFVLLTMVVNALRFGSPFESGYNYSEQIFDSDLGSVYDHGIFNLGYIGRHVAVFWEQMPRFADHGPFVWPSWAGLAVWATSPPLFYGLFIHLRDYRRVALAMAMAITAACAFLLASAVWTNLGLADFGPRDMPFGAHLAPFWILVAAALALALAKRDRLVLACWAAIVPLTLANWLFAATGWTQFGYRYGLDFMPFLFLLAVMAVPRLRWHHVLLIGAAVVVNLWGLLWTFKFNPIELMGWTWVGW